MARPGLSRRDIYVDTVATSFAVGYKNETYIASQILPFVPVAKPTGKYFVYNASAWFRDEADERAPGTRASRGNWSMDDQGTYATVEYAFAMGLPDEVRDQADDPLSPERTTVEFVTDKILLRLEREVAAALFNATTFASYTAAITALTGGVQVAWDTFETSDPIQDVNAMKDLISGKIGRQPNTLIVGYEVHTKLKIHPVLKEAVKYTQVRGAIPNQEIANLLGVEKYLVGEALYETAEEGTTSSFARVWGKNILLAYVTPSPALMSPSLGYVLEYKTREANRYREDQEGQDVFEVKANWVSKVCAAQAGYYVTAVVS